MQILASSFSHLIVIAFLRSYISIGIGHGILTNTIINSKQFEPIFFFVAISQSEQKTARIH